MVETSPFESFFFNFPFQDTSSQLRATEVQSLSMMFRCTWWS